MLQGDDGGRHVQPGACVYVCVYVLCFAASLSMHYQVVCLARCNGAHVVVSNLADRTTEEEFRQHVIETSQKKNDFLIASYSRKGLHHHTCF